jgi:hypothetical protein
MANSELTDWVAGAEVMRPGVMLDDSGKAVLDHVYNLCDPRSYFSVLRALSYRIPDAAQPIIRRLLPVLARARKRDRLKLIDVGCSYGVTGQLLRSGRTIDWFFAHYANHAQYHRCELIVRDRKLYQVKSRESVEIIGLDIAAHACAYAVESGAVDGAVVANLELHELNAQQVDLLKGADLIVSTGFIGYGGTRTITRILDACIESRPWMVHFVMRLFDYAPIQAALAERDYVTSRGSSPIFQRLFASELEAQEIVRRLLQRGCDPTGLEDRDGIYAELYMSRPAEERHMIDPDDVRHLLTTNDQAVSGVGRPFNSRLG